MDGAGDEEEVSGEWRWSGEQRVGGGREEGEGEGGRGRKGSKPPASSELVSAPGPILLPRLCSFLSPAST